MTTALLTWNGPDGLRELRPGQRQVVIAGHGDAAGRLLTLSRSHRIDGRDGQHVSRPAGCRMLVISPAHRLLGGHTVAANLTLALALGTASGTARRDIAGRCREALARIQPVIDLPAQMPAEDLSVLQRLAAQWALAWLLPHDLVWLDRPGQSLAAAERQRLLTLADAHRHDFPLRAQVHADLIAPTGDWPVADAIRWDDAPSTPIPESTAA